jgi:hypothetical protein
LRRMVDWWYYVKPFANFPILRDIWVIRRQQKDDEWKVLTYKYIWKDDKWDEVLKEKPIDEYYWFFFKPTVWGLYDDLHKNIADPEKYTALDLKLIWEILNWKPELQQFLDKEQFKPIKDNLIKESFLKLESEKGFKSEKIEKTIKKPNLNINKTLYDQNIKQNTKFNINNL